MNEKEKILRKVNKTYNQLKEKHKELKMEGCNLSVRIFRDELLKYIKYLQNKSLK